MAMNQQKKEKKIGTTVIVWGILALALLIAFFIKRDDILTTLKKTGFFTHLIGSEPSFVENFEIEETESKKSSDSNPSSTVIIQNDPNIINEPIIEFQDLEPIDLGGIGMVEEPTTLPVTSADELESLPQESFPDPSETIIETPYGNITAEQSAGIVAEETNVRLFFVVLDNDGSVSRKEVVRRIPKTNSPLSASINTLLEGPNADDVIDNCMTLIPTGSQLLSASVKDGVATLNFSEEFEFNPYGVEGYLAQLMQVVYTASTFPTVESVQFVVEGQRKEYLGSEGVWIGTPLSVSSFK